MSGGPGLNVQGSIGIGAHGSAFGGSVLTSSTTLIRGGSGTGTATTPGTAATTLAVSGGAPGGLCVTALDLAHGHLYL